MEEEDKLLYIYHWIKQYPEERFIVFLNSITYANKVTSMLRVLGVLNLIYFSYLPLLCIHSNSKDKDCQNSINSLKRNAIF